MKNTLLFFLLALLATTTAKAQGDSFAPIGAEWYYGSRNYYNFPHYSRFRVEKDTMVVGVACRKISGIYVPRDSISRPLDDIYVYSTRDTVFYYNHTFGRFTPLYIFNVEEGDTMTYNLPDYKYPPHFEYSSSGPTADSIFKVVVQKTELITINGKNLKKIWPSHKSVDSFLWYFRCTNYIERIGSDVFIIPHSYPSFPEFMEFSLRCYSDHEISYQLTEPCDTLFQRPTGLTQPNNRSNNGIAVFPNPSYGRFVIRMGEAENIPIELLLMDITGKTVKKIVIPPKEKEVYCSLNLSAGIYLLKYNVNNVVYFQKVAIQP